MSSAERPFNERLRSRAEKAMGSGSSDITRAPRRAANRVIGPIHAPMSTNVAPGFAQASTNEKVPGSQLDTCCQNSSWTLSFVSTIKRSPRICTSVVWDGFSITSPRLPIRPTYPVNAERATVPGNRVPRIYTTHFLCRNSGSRAPRGRTDPPEPVEGEIPVTQGQSVGRNISPLPPVGRNDGWGRAASVPRGRGGRAVAGTPLRGKLYLTTCPAFFSQHLKKLPRPMFHVKHPALNTARSSAPP